LVDLTNTGVTGKVAEESLDRAGITVNKNTIPNETRSPFVTSGIRLGTPALTTRGMGPDEMQLIAGFIVEALEKHEDSEALSNIHKKVNELCEKFPLY
jgi:glycine hydroxymethyltransferase